MRALKFRHALIAVLLSVSTASAIAGQSRYETALATWTSYQDVSTWLRANFVFDKARQTQGMQQLKAVGPAGILTRRPDTLFDNKTGYCRDAAGFAKDALNKINPDYQARYIFIKNQHGPPNHWVTGFVVDGDLYVMDHGAGKHWQAMSGVHGPYASLKDYQAFLSSLSIASFAPASVQWRDIPGEQD